MGIVADVVNLTTAHPTDAHKFGLDTNVLVWQSYSRIGVPPPHSRLYSAFLKRALNQRAGLFVSMANLVELTHLIERVEYGLAGGSSLGSLKDFRKKESHRASVSQEVQISWGSVESISTLVEPILAKSSVENFLAGFPASVADAYDGCLIEAYREQGITHIVSDDADLATWPDIVLCTANQAVLHAAVAANKLVNL